MGWATESEMTDKSVHKTPVMDASVYKTPEDMVVHFLDEERNAKNPEDKAHYRFMRLLISSYSEACVESAKMIGAVETMSNVPSWLGTMYIGASAHLMRPERRQKIINIATLAFHTALTEGIKAIEEDEAERRVSR
jgi:hypothetical protein